MKRRIWHCFACLDEKKDMTLPFLHWWKEEYDIALMNRRIWHCLSCLEKQKDGTLPYWTGRMGKGYLHGGCWAKDRMGKTCVTREKGAWSWSTEGVGGLQSVEKFRKPRRHGQEWAGFGCREDGALSPLLVDYSFRESLRYVDWLPMFSLKSGAAA